MRAPRLSTDEQKALGFVALMLVLSGVARGMAPEPARVQTDAAAVDVPALVKEDSVIEAREARRDRPLATDERVDVNRADEDELQRLPGVGPSTARSIVAARDTARFVDPDDLLRVRGIGPAKLAGMREHVRVQ